MPYNLLWQVRNVDATYMPNGIFLLGLLAMLLCLGGFMITIGSFVFGIMKNNKLAVVLSSVTFVLSFIILPATLWFADATKPKF